MNNTKNEITSIQLMAFVIAGQIGVGILALPSVLAREVGHDGWISTLLSGIICLVLAVIIMFLMKRYKNKNIFEINILLYGKICGYLLNFVFVTYLFLITGITIRIFVEITNIIILKLTPPMVITLLILTPSIYAVSKGLKVICRFDVLVFLCYFILIFSVLLTTPNLRLTYILPIGKAGMLPILKSVGVTIYSFLGFELTALFYPNVKNKEKAVKCILFGMIFTTIIYTFIVALSTVFFGEIKLSMLLFPTYSMEQSIVIPVLERMDTLFILFWFPTMGSTIRSYLFSAYYSVALLFNFKRKYLIITIVTIILITISRIPPNFEATLRYSTFSGIFGTLIIGMMVITYLISFYIKKEEGANSN